MIMNLGGIKQSSIPKLIHRPGIKSYKIVSGRTPVFAYPGLQARQAPLKPGEV